MTSHVTEHDQCQVFVDVPPSVSPGRGGGGVQLHGGYIEKTNVKISFINSKLPYLNAMICTPIKFLTAEYCLCICKFK